MIAVPSHDMVSARFAVDLAQLYALSVANLPGAVDLNTVIGTYVHTARERLASDALAIGASHVLWIDADMRFPRDTLLRLLARNLPAVGINYSTRETPGTFTAKHLGARVITGPDAHGLEEVSGMGFGLLLMRTAVLSDTLTRGGAPLFRYDWIAGHEESEGEDYSFCRRARDFGHRFYVDHDLSKECAHIGAHEFRTDNAVPHLECVT